MKVQLLRIFLLFLAATPGLQPGLQAQDFSLSTPASVYNLTMGGANDLDIKFRVWQDLQSFPSEQLHRVVIDYEVGLYDANAQIFYPIGNFGTANIPNREAIASLSVFNSFSCDWGFGYFFSPYDCNAPNYPEWDSVVLNTYQVDCSIPSGTYELKVRITQSDYTVSGAPYYTPTYNGVPCAGTNTNCMLPALATVNWNNNAVSASLTGTNGAPCNAPGGSFSLAINSGVSPYGVQWVSASHFGSEAGITGSSYTSPGSLPAGTYTVTITDDNGCISTLPGVVIPSTSPIPTVSIGTQTATCNNSDGSATINLSNGTPTWSYFLNGPVNQTGLMAPNSFPLNNLSAGIYSFQAIDVNGCTVQRDFMVQQRCRRGDPPSTLRAGETLSEGGSFFQVYPNPVADYLFLSHSETDGQLLVVELFDLQGRLQYRQAVVPAKDPIKLSLPALAEGCYLLRIRSGYTILHTEKIIRQ